MIPSSRPLPVVNYSVVEPLLSGKTRQPCQVARDMESCREVDALPRAAASRRLMISRQAAKEYTLMSQQLKISPKMPVPRTFITVEATRTAKIRKKNTAPSRKNDTKRGDTCDIVFSCDGLQRPSSKSLAMVIMKKIVAISVVGIHAVRAKITLGRAKQPGHGRPRGAVNVVSCAFLAETSEQYSSSANSTITKNTRNTRTFTFFPYMALSRMTKIILTIVVKSISPNKTLAQNHVWQNLTDRPIML